MDNLPAGLLLIAAGVVTYLTRNYSVDQSFEMQKNFWDTLLSDASREFSKKWITPAISLMAVLFGILVIFGVI